MMQEFGTYLNTFSESTILVGCWIVALLLLYGLSRIDNTMDRD
jgi:hypothetical protein